MKYYELQQQVVEANLAIVDAGLVLLTWGNASVVDRRAGVVAIKPSGVAYAELRPEEVPIVSLEDGRVVSGTLRPSSDTPTHLVLFRAFPEIGAVVHTHSHHAVCFAQALLPLPCFGTTHADHFAVDVPVTRALSSQEIQDDYEGNTGEVIVERFRDLSLDAMHCPGVLVASHGPFAWGADARSAVENAIVLEEVARMAMHTMAIRSDAAKAPLDLVRKHFGRKHGPGAYYGQDV